MKANRGSTSDVGLQPGPRDSDEILAARTRVKETSTTRGEALDELASELAKTVGVFNAAATEFNAHREQKLTDLEDLLESAQEETRTSIENRREAFRDDFDAFGDSLSQSCAGADWLNHDVWARDPGRGAEAGPPSFVRMGLMSEDQLLGAEVPVITPAPIIGTGHVLISAPDSERPTALGLVQGLVLRSLASMPLGRVQYQVFDPKGLGGSVDSLGDFTKFDGRVAHGIPVTTDKELTAAVTGLRTKASKVSAQYLRGRYDTLTEFLTTNPGVETYEILVLLDFPRGIRQDLLESIQALAYDGPARGVSLIVHTDDPAALTDELGERVTRVELGRGGASVSSTWLDGGTTSLRFAPDPPPPSATIDAVASRELRGTAELDFSTLIMGELWSHEATRAVHTSIGVAGLDRVEVSLGDDPVHGLIGGASGMGKSNLLRCLIYGLSHRYPPEELSFYLLDFKEGVEFAEFAYSDRDPTWLPQAKVVAVNSDRRFGTAVLEHLAAVTKKRYEHIQDMGLRKYAELRAARSESVLPRVVLVADEFHTLFGEADQYTERSLAALKLLAKQGRAAGVHLILASQTVSDIGRGTGQVMGQMDGIFQQFNLRIALKTTPQESTAILGSGNKAAAELAERGSAIVNQKLGHIEANRETVIAKVDEQAVSEIRQTLSATAVQQGATNRPRIFDGRSAADSSGVMKRIATAAGPPPSDAVMVEIGSTLTIDPDDPALDVTVSAAFRPDPDRHMAILGSGAREACSILAWTVHGLVARAEAGSASFTFVDCLRPDDAPEAPEGYAGWLADLASKYGHSARVVSRTEAVPLLQEVAEAVDEMPSGSRHFIVLLGFDRVSGLNRPDPQTREKPVDAFRKILDEGALVDHHFIGWWMTTESFSELTGPRLKGRFGMTTLLRVPAQELRGLAPAGYVWEPERHRALWTDRSGHRDPVVFVPFELPDLSVASEDRIGEVAS